MEGSGKDQDADILFRYFSIRNFNFYVFRDREGEA